MYRIAIITLSALIAGCSGPQTPEKGRDDYRAVIQAWHDSHPVCLVLTATFPFELRVRGREDQQRRFDALADVGLLAVESFTKEERSIRGGTEPAAWVRYRSTQAGASALRPVSAPMVTATNLCFATKRVDAVEAETPVELAGMRVVRVSYRWRLENVAPWARAPAVQAAFPLIATGLSDAKGQARGSLVPSGDGWTFQPSAG